MGLETTSSVSSIDSCTGFLAKISNSELTKIVCHYRRSRATKECPLWKYISFIQGFLLLLLRLRRSCLSITVRAVVVVAFIFRLRPRPLRIFPTNSDRYFATMSIGVTSELVFWARSARILPPVRTNSRHRVLAPLQRIGLIQRQKPVRTQPMRCPRWTKCGRE